MEITSNVILDEPLNKIKPKLPIENIITLQDQIVKMHHKRKPLIQQLNLLTDSSHNYTEKDVDDMEKLEEEIEFITNYSKTLMDQMVCIMNEHDVRDIPLLKLD